jgi:CheY-like chemotaxis protein
MVLPPLGTTNATRQQLARRPDLTPKETYSTDMREGKLAGYFILVIDDDESARYIARRTLSAAGAQVVCVASLEDALTLLDLVRPHAVVVDLVLERESGLEFVRRAQELPAYRTRRLSVVAYSAFGDEAMRVDARAAGFDEFVFKPDGSGALIAALQRAVEARGGD